MALSSLPVQIEVNCWDLMNLLPSLFQPQRQHQFHFWLRLGIVIQQYLVGWSWQCVRCFVLHHPAVSHLATGLFRLPRFSVPVCLISWRLWPRISSRESHLCPTTRGWFAINSFRRRRGGGNEWQRWRHESEEWKDIQVLWRRPFLHDSMIQFQFVLFSRSRQYSIDSSSIKDDPDGEPRYRCSRDEKKALEIGIPFPIHDIVNLPMDEFNDMLSRHELNEEQLNLCRDIRRRGKNKARVNNGLTVLLFHRIFHDRFSFLICRWPPRTAANVRSTRFVSCPSKLRRLACASSNLSMSAMICTGRETSGPASWCCSRMKSSSPWTRVPRSGHWTWMLRTWRLSEDPALKQKVPEEAHQIRWEIEFLSFWITFCKCVLSSF